MLDINGWQTTHHNNQSIIKKQLIIQQMNYSANWKADSTAKNILKQKKKRKWCTLKSSKLIFFHNFYHRQVIILSQDKMNNSKIQPLQKWESERI